MSRVETMGEHYGVSTGSGTMAKYKARLEALDARLAVQEALDAAARPAPTTMTQRWARLAKLERQVAAPAARSTSTDGRPEYRVMVVAGGCTSEVVGDDEASVRAFAEKLRRRGAMGGNRVYRRDSSIYKRGR